MCKIVLDIHLGLVFKVVERELVVRAKGWQRFLHLRQGYCGQITTLWLHFGVLGGKQALPPSDTMNAPPQLFALSLVTCIAPILPVGGVTTSFKVFQACGVVSRLFAVDTSIANFCTNFLLKHTLQILY